MGPVLNGLTKLQSIENQLRAAKAKLVRCRRNVVIQENQIRALQNSLEAKHEEIQLTKIQSDRLELEIKTRDESVAKLRASLNIAKTNKEYSAVLTQLNTTNADNSKIETQVLELLKNIELDEANFKKIEQDIDEQKGKLDHIRKEAEVLAVKYESEIAEIQLEWDQLSKTIPSEMLDVFERVAETYDGEAMAIVEKQPGKIESYGCGGCFMGITAESVNLLMTKDEIIRCPNCTRILVLGDS
ncbi:MAG: hypothetical protein KAQ89_04170 [Planctomycetes bacterium]|nr:hypothetical protein [Planctomycetota bacterium]